MSHCTKRINSASLKLCVHPQIVAVAARDLQHAEEFAKKHNIPRAYGSYDELAKDPDVGGSFCQHMAQCFGLIEATNSTQLKCLQASH